MLTTCLPAAKSRANEKAPMSRQVYLFGAGSADGDASQKALLGGKGAGLAEMSRLGIPVPPGFTITTEVAVEYASRGAEAITGDLEGQVRAALARVESMVGRRLGDREKPLLLSVRSGARASMPGMLDTILNLGINDEVARVLAKEMQSERFAYDSYRRFITMYADVVLHVKRSYFDEQLDRVRNEVAVQSGLPASQWNNEELKRRVPDSAIPAESLVKLVAL